MDKDDVVQFLKKAFKEIGVFCISFLIAAIAQIIIGQSQNPIAKPTLHKLILTHIWQGGMYAYVFIGVLCWLVGIILLRVRSYSRCPYFESPPSGPEVTMSLEGVLLDIGGLYDDLQDSHQPLGEPSVRNKIRKLRSDPVPSIPAIAFVANNCPISSYAKIARELDVIAEKSVLSVNTSLPSELFNHGAKDSVISHLDAVNNLGKRKHRERIQILAQDGTNDYPDGMRTKSEFERDLSNDQDLKNLWEEHFVAVSSGIIYREYYWNNQVTPHDFFGDFVLYDKELLLLYDYATRKLLILLGRKMGTTFGSIFGEK